MWLLLWTSQLQSVRSVVLILIASSAAALAGLTHLALGRAVLQASSHPLAITMWDFSWLERRWPGAGYEDWDEILDQLVARGYDAVRIDAFPHLIAAEPHRIWELIPVWSVQDWGSPAKNRVQVQPALNQFIRKCSNRGLRVALSTWFRQDTTDRRMTIRSAHEHGAIWKETWMALAPITRVPWSKIPRTRPRTTISDFCWRRKANS